jgi:2,3-bisphosphoglycerate-independent phosphoglycerate mutase
MKNKVFFFFLDGFGLAPPSPHNPMAVFKVLSNVIGKPLTTNAMVATPDMLINGLDATLGVAGTPQSATGQTTLFTGVNAAKVCEGHIPAFPPPKLRSIIKLESLFKKAVETGHTATFANCYRDQYFELVRAGKREHSVTTLSVMAAEIPLRRIPDYQAGMALFCDITGEHLIFPSAQPLAPITPIEAGKRICRLCNEFDLVVFETFLPDVIGHKRNWGNAERFCNVLSSFIETIIAQCGSSTTIVMTSDHGNFEDFTTGNHTKNPVALCAFGPGSLFLTGVTSIDQISNSLLHILLSNASQSGRESS